MKNLIFAVSTIFLITANVYGHQHPLAQSGVFCEILSSASTINVKAIGNSGKSIYESRISFSQNINKEEALEICNAQVRLYSYASQTGTNYFKTLFDIGNHAVLVFDREQSIWINPRNGQEVKDRDPTYLISPSWDDAFRYVANASAQKLEFKLKY
ncbi:MAG: hypothetical protein QE271_07025 [Bacteriovoracaceae bacterium]|nr:hypothetical protein [Bacteriovoracaceae bacterium]